MDFQLSEEQAALVAAVQDVVRDHEEIPQAERLRSYFFSAKLQQLLDDNGFLNAGRELGPLEAALVVAETARIAAVTEVAASALVAPQILGDERLEGPIALIAGRDLTKAHRNLPIARTALIDLDEDVGVVSIASDDVAAVNSILAYPYGRFLRLPDLSKVRRLPGQGAKLRQWWRVALATEFAAAAQSAVACTINHVLQRQVFGHPVGVFQAVQHRLVQCHVVATGVHLLALRAAWSGQSYDADVAACYAQEHVKKLLVDLHQFTGGMGITNEFPLHFWTYRLRALQSEAGGLVEAALGMGHQRWDADTSAEAATKAAAEVVACPA